MFVDGLGVGMDEADEFLSGMTIGVEQKLYPVHFGRDVTHIAELQGGGDVVAEEVNAGMEILR